MEGRRYSDGLHQAIEAKEGVHIAGENQTLATITLQNYFRMYNKLSGMTGTAETEAAEFVHTYGLQIVVIPTNKPVQRIDHADLVYKTRKEKIEAIIKRIEELHAKGQPVLVGTISIKSSEELSELLKARGIKHNVLNAKYHAKEAEIVAQAGRFGAVTIATNMAGRGTDIMLGGNPEFLAVAEVGSREAENYDILRKYTPFPLISESVNYFKEYEPINLMGVPIQLLSYSLIINLVFAIIVIALGYYFYNTNFRES